jgi:hypothetical protein
MTPPEGLILPLVMTRGGEQRNEREGMQLPRLPGNGYRLKVYILVASRRSSH